ncbi:MAG: hypothetical protein E7403_07145 [Ruminococcaceae bacterium]|nr:hypothetical protein [Oscillospiraceae bacterium]
MTYKERYIGDRIKISVESGSSEIGPLYRVKSNTSISKKLIFYKSPVSKTKIHLPEDILAGVPVVFTIQEKTFRPRFETYEELAECFNIEG